MVLPHFHSTFTWNGIRQCLSITFLIPFEIKSSAPIQRPPLLYPQSQGTVSELEGWVSSVLSLLTSCALAAASAGHLCWTIWLLWKPQQDIPRTWVQTVRLFPVLAVINWTQKHLSAQSSSDLDISRKAFFSWVLLFGFLNWNVWP